ncbi:unnamed protein product [Merluccius merluccius]
MEMLSQCHSIWWSQVSSDPAQFKPGPVLTRPSSDPDQFRPGPVQTQTHQKPTRRSARPPAPRSQCSLAGSLTRVHPPEEPPPRMENQAGGTEDRAHVRGPDPIETCWDPRGWKDIQVCC